MILIEVKDLIRVAWTPDGELEAAYRWPKFGRVVVHPTTGTVIAATVQVGTDDYRHLARAAREFVRDGDRRECR
jgi:hypothetical protein